MVLCLYLIILTKLILFKFFSLSYTIHHDHFNHLLDHWRSSNFIPLKMIIFYLFIADMNRNIRLENLAGNIIGFVPFGFILPLITKRFLSFKKTWIATFILSLTFEIFNSYFQLGALMSTI